MDQNPFLYRRGHVFDGPEDTDKVQVEVHIPIHLGVEKYEKAFEELALGYFKKQQDKGKIEAEEEPELERVEHPYVDTFGFIGGKWLSEAAKSAGITLHDGRRVQKRIAELHKKNLRARRIHRAIDIKVNPEYLG